MARILSPNGLPVEGCCCSSIIYFIKVYHNTIQGDCVTPRRRNSWQQVDGVSCPFQMHLRVTTMRQRDHWMTTAAHWRILSLLKFSSHRVAFLWLKWRADEEWRQAASRLWLDGRDCLQAIRAKLYLVHNSPPRNPGSIHTVEQQLELNSTMNSIKIVYVQSI